MPLVAHSRHSVQRTTSSVTRAYAASRLIRSSAKNKINMLAEIAAVNDPPIPQGINVKSSTAQNTTNADIDASSPCNVRTAPGYPWSRCANTAITDVTIGNGVNRPLINEPRPRAAEVKPITSIAVANILDGMSQRRTVLGNRGELDFGSSSMVTRSAASAAMALSHHRLGNLCKRYVIPPKQIQPEIKLIGQE